MTSATIWRQSILNERHRELGSKLEESWNDMAIPQHYATDPYAETEAVRTRAGLFDVSALKIINVSGKDALAFLNQLVTADIAKVPAGRSMISSIVDDEGGLIDDVLIYADGDGAYRLSHGGGALEDALPLVAEGFDVAFSRDNDVHILSLQGPKALDILSPHTPMDLKSLPYFGHGRTTLFGVPVSLARGGYSAERGYEVFCAAKDAVALWDKILEAGAPFGAMPVSWDCLDIVRVEGALLFFPFDMPHKDTTPFEVLMDWSVDLSKPDFRGKAALLARKGTERTHQAGLEVLAPRAITPGAKIFKDGVEAGVVNSTTYSQHLMKSLALVSLQPAFTALGTVVSVTDGDESFEASVVRTPFYDPMRLRTHPLEERG
ncbi:aminomethyl transferase family protein [Xanthobacter dioxanivorans]|uniref:Aminomethyl transferase family protein n=1 Tax=Xanthobacter dioxanivorans TaxID=2528964 RepID=A0A974PJV6_9HYPH|nr:aminomethyltransferase family protein [Xanthobacter dioxanivorans]QRG04859.1 aminomethyl transferase family protein [Xanthobacter dioxanivorans]